MQYHGNRSADICLVMQAVGQPGLSLSLFVNTTTSLPYTRLQSWGRTSSTRLRRMTTRNRKWRSATGVASSSDARRRCSTKSRWRRPSSSTGRRRRPRSGNRSARARSKKPGSPFPAGDFWRRWDSNLAALFVILYSTNVSQYCFVVLSHSTVS